MTNPSKPTVSVEGLTRGRLDPSHARAVSGLLCLSFFDDRRQVLLLLAEPLVDAYVDRLAYGEERAQRAVVLEPAEAFVDVLERHVPGMLTGGSTNVMNFQPAVVRGAARADDAS